MNKYLIVFPFLFAIIISSCGNKTSNINTLESKIDTCQKNIIGKWRGEKLNINIEKNGHYELNSSWSTLDLAGSWSVSANTFDSDKDTSFVLLLKNDKCRLNSYGEPMDYLNYAFIINKLSESEMTLIDLSSAYSKGGEKKYLKRITKVNEKEFITDKRDSTVK